MDDLKAKKSLHEASELRPVKYLNNTIEQDHRRIKRVVKLGLSFGSFHTARHILKGYEAMAMIRKGQIQNVDRDDVIGRLSFIHLIFGITA